MFGNMENYLIKWRPRLLLPCRPRYSIVSRVGQAGRWPSHSYCALLAKFRCNCVKKLI